MPAVTVGGALSASFANIPVVWARAWGVMLLAIWLNALMQVVVSLRPTLFWVEYLAFPFVIAVGNAVIGAIYRVGLEGDHAGNADYRVGPAGFAWGTLEWRVLGANVLVAMVWGVLAAFALIVCAIVLGVGAALSGESANAADALARVMFGPAGLVSLIVAVPSLIGLTLLGAKMSLFAVTAADAGKFEFGRAWSMTRGVLAPIIVTWLVIGLIDLIAVSVSLGSNAAVMAGQTWLIWLNVAAQAVAGAVISPMFYGLQVYIYRGRR